MYIISDYQIRNILIIYSIAILYWGSITLYRHIVDEDVEILQKKYIYRCNGWCISHIINYIILGYLAPKYWYILIFIGFCFELVETSLSRLSKFIKGKIINDTITNSLGVFIGLFIFYLFPHKIDLINFKLIK
jgi:uncharacterized protein YacL